MKIILSTLIALAIAGTADSAPDTQSALVPDTSLITVPVGHDRIFKLLDILPDEDKVRISFALESVDGTSENHALSFAYDGSAAVLTNNTPKSSSSAIDTPVLGYSCQVDGDNLRLDIMYGEQTVRVTLFSDDAGPVDFVFLHGQEQSTVHFSATAEFDEAVDLFLAIDRGDQSKLTLDRREARLFEKAKALRWHATSFLAQE